MLRKTPDGEAIWRKPQSLRNRLLTLAALPLVPAVLLVLLLIVLQAMRIQEEAQASALRTTRALAVAVDSRLREVEASLAALTVSDSLRNQDLATFYKQALLFQVSTGLGTVVVLDEHGRQVVNTSQPYGAPLPALGAQASTMPVIVEGRPMARVIKAPSSGEPLAVVSVPVRINGQVRYALSTTIGFRHFDDLLREQSLPPTWIGSIVDPERVVVARTIDGDKFVGTPAPGFLVDAMSRYREGAFDGVSVEGIPVRTIYSSTGYAGWAVAVGVPKAELARELHRPLLWFSVSTLFVLGLAVASAWWYAQRIGRAMARLTDAARELGEGEAVRVPPLGILEADELAAAMTRASSELRGNEARWSAVLESAMDGIVAVDESQRIVIYNPAAERIFGWSVQEAMGQPLGMLIPPEHRGTHEVMVRQFGRTGETSRRMGAGVVVSGLRKGGAGFPIEASISHVDMGGNQLYTVIIRDVTEAVRVRDDLTQMAGQASRVREEEKARIARELHDELAQSLAVLRMDLVQLGSALRTSHADAEQNVARMVAGVDASVAATRRIAADLRPLILDDLGLAAAIEWLGEEFTGRTGVACTVRLEGDLDLPEPYATGVFRILQEALVNVAKHARAHRVEVSGVRNATDILFAVVDDGVGFDTGGPRKPLSLGLAGLRERVHLLEGKLVVTSSPDHGTRLEVTIPAPATARTVDISPDGPDSCS
ncbi:MAG: PAS domain S-box protein [Polaromonas sp.]|uniref:PAS domain S-box protein n=1 Tax=Polaromonas sp. TaxID=1869339 RepID=UPI00272F3CF3|nr:PAS domain S-box protein [Polaromonas sp.]MDP2450527.1 PAS domain S-box protein [Polaromonas sp.]MDP3247450.1 PAS domain S-box protein [Polaromonas sp.]MDP3755501.1 PAS domain S-box protein [Polaromonas sp.]MDP3829047.1 PAS domain S-box protein [Polaromonas sp.]